MAEPHDSRARAGSAIAWSTPPLALAPTDKDEAVRWLGELDARLAAQDEPQFAAALDARPDMRALLGAVFTLSPFLRDCAMIRPQVLVLALARPIDRRFRAIAARDKQAGRRRLERSRTDGWPARRPAPRRSDLRSCRSRRLVGRGKGYAGADRLRRRRTWRGGWLPAAPDPRHRQIGPARSGQTGRGLRTYRAGDGQVRRRRTELFERYRPGPVLRPADARSLRTDDPTSLFSQLARSLVRILQERTGDGYVFRVDLRLRPDPGSTPLAIPVETALDYYEAYGQNWERAAMIKARPVAGDTRRARHSCTRLSPFIWRKSSRLCGDRRHPLDQAPDPCPSRPWRDRRRRPQRQARPRRHPRDRVLRPDPAADRRRPRAGTALPRAPSTRSTRSLRHGWIERRRPRRYGGAYRFLRARRTRIQMVADEQTHKLPADDAGLERIALMIGYNGVAPFRRELTADLRTVEKHYADLFEHAEGPRGGGRQSGLHRRR